MIQLLLTLMGFFSPHNQMNPSVQSIAINSDHGVGADLDTSGETTQLPPKK